MKKSLPSKIVFAHLYNDYSGSPYVLSQVVEILLACDNSLEIEMHVGSGSEGFLSSLDIKTETYLYKRMNNRLLTLFTYLMSQLILFFKLLRYRNDDVQIYVNTLMPFGASLAGWITKKNVVCHMHETSIKPRFLKWFLRLVVKHTASKIIFVSQYLRDTEGFGTDREVVIYNSLSEGFWLAATKREYDWGSENFKVLMACSLREYKGIQEFLEVCSGCAGYESIKFTLILNATDEEVSRYFGDKAVPKNLKILGKQPDLTGFYGSTNLVLNLSRPEEWIETFGLTILEAMAFGIPVIVPPVGGPSELVRHGLEGFLISSTDVYDIVQKIRQLSENRELCRVMSIAAQERADNFSASNFRSEVERLFF